MYPLGFRRPERNAEEDNIVSEENDTQAAEQLLECKLLSAKLRVLDAYIYFC